MAGLDSGTQGKGKSVGHAALKLLAFLLLIYCFLLLLHHLRVSLLAGGGRKPVILALSLNQVILLFYTVLLAGELTLATTVHGNGTGSGLPPVVSLFFLSDICNMLASSPPVLPWCWGVKAALYPSPFLIFIL